jgi:hypothetical protein
MINDGSCFVGLLVGPEEINCELLLMSKKLSAVHPGEVLREE